MGAVAATAVAILLRFQFDAVLPAGFPFLTFFPAIIITSFVLGSGPGILTAVLGFFAAWYFFIPPAFSFAMSQQTAVALGFYVFIASVDIFIIDRLMRVSMQLVEEKAHAERLVEEKNTLFTEVQHRIGNNLQAISSLLQIQSRTVTDPAAQRALMEAVHRVSIVADIQRRFHNINMHEGVIDDRFVQDIARGSMEAAGVADRFVLTTDVTALSLPQDRFMAVALVMMECVNNALEHALPPQVPHGGGRRRLAISLKPDPETQMQALVVADDGEDLPPDFDPATSPSIGMKVILAFARQIGGRFTIRREGGAVCRLEFPTRPIEA
jgi:two-component system, sensor histidine kinase PdtaS